MGWLDGALVGHELIEGASLGVLLGLFDVLGLAVGNSVGLAEFVGA